MHRFLAVCSDSLLLFVWWLQIHEAVLSGGKVLIPVFAVGRAQELLLLLDEFWERTQLTVSRSSNLAHNPAGAPLLREDTCRTGRGGVFSCLSCLRLMSQYCSWTAVALKAGLLQVYAMHSPPIHFICPCTTVSHWPMAASNSPTPASVTCHTMPCHALLPGAWPYLLQWSYCRQSLTYCTSAIPCQGLLFLQSPDPHLLQWTHGRPCQPVLQAAYELGQ